MALGDGALVLWLDIKVLVVFKQSALYNVVCTNTTQCSTFIHYSKVAKAMEIGSLHVGLAFHHQAPHFPTGEINLTLSKYYHFGHQLHE